MTRNEVEILLKTVYKGEGATKALQDMDKISASGQKVAGALKMTNQQAATVFSGVSASTRARNPQLFNTTTGGGSGGGVPPTIPSGGAPASPAPGGGGGGARQAHGGLGQFGYRFASQFSIGRAAALGGAAGVAGAAAGIALKKIFDLLRGSLERLVGAFENARKLYANSLTTGFGLQMTAERAGLSEVLGVSEKDLFQFGQSIKFVGNRLDFSNSIIAKTAPSLTATAYQFRILKKDLDSLFASLASDAAPSIRIFADGISRFVVALTRFFHDDPIGKLILQLSTLNIKGAGYLLGGKDSSDAPNPVSYMQQIHASALEHMGLVVGGIGQGTDSAAQTAHNTKVTATAVTMMAKILSASGGLARGGNFGTLSSSNP